MSQPSDNPYSFAAAKESHRDSETGLRLLEAYQYVFANPNWIRNLLFAGLAMLIPAIGVLVVIGYFMIVSQSLHFRLSPTYPDFEFSRLQTYLMRGLWPFLVALILALLFVPLTLGFMIAPGYILWLAPANNQTSAIALAVVVGLVGMIVILVSQMLMSIMMLRAGWTESFMEGFNFSAAWDFVSKVWFEFFLERVFVAVTAPLVQLCGLILFFVGMYPATALVMFAQFHLLAQLYGLYLARGGIPIAAKELSLLSIDQDSIAVPLPALGK